MLRAIGRVLAWPLLLLVQAYRYLISPWLGANCRFQPTCSVYAIEALQRHRVGRAVRLIVARLCRCHPWGGFGVDRVPETHGDRS